MSASDKNTIMDSENITIINPSLSDHDYPLTESVVSTRETRSLAKQPIPTKIYDSESTTEGRNSRSRQNGVIRSGIVKSKQGHKTDKNSREDISIRGLVSSENDGICSGGSLFTDMPNLISGRVSEPIKRSYTKTETASRSPSEECSDNVERSQEDYFVSSRLNTTISAETKQEIMQWAIDLARSGVIENIPISIQRNCPINHEVRNTSTPNGNQPVYQTPSRSERVHRDNEGYGSNNRTNRSNSRHYLTSSQEDGSNSDKLRRELRQRNLETIRQRSIGRQSSYLNPEDDRRSRNTSTLIHLESSESTDTDSIGEHTSRLVNFTDNYSGRHSSNNHRHRSRGDFIRLDRYDGSTSLEAFLAHFDNCSRYNNWTYNDKISQLKAALTGSAAEILLESERNMSYRELRNELKECYGTDGCENQYESQLKTRRRQKGETLRSLYQDINRLVLQAYPGQSGRIRDKLAVDAFITSLNDPELELSVRNGCSDTLRQSFRSAMMFESNRTLVRGTETSRERRRFDVQARVATNENWHSQPEQSFANQSFGANNVQNNEAVSETIESKMTRKLVELENMIKQLQNNQSKGPNNNNNNGRRFNNFKGNNVNMQNNGNTQPSNSWQEQRPNVGPPNRPPWQEQRPNLGPPNCPPWPNSTVNHFPTSMQANFNGYPSTPSRPREPRRCYTCGQLDHLRPQCPHKPPKGSCYSCGQYGHYNYSCPQLQQTSGVDNVNSYQNQNFQHIGTVAPTGYVTNEFASVELGRPQRERQRPNYLDAFTC